LVDGFILYQNYPNPFNPTTKIGFQISAFGFVSLKIYDVLGNEVVTLLNEEKSVGTYEIEFNALNVSSGIYFYQLKVLGPEINSGQGTIQTKKMVYLK